MDSLHLHRVTVTSRRRRSPSSLSRDLGMQLIIENFCEIVICDFGGHDSSSLTFLSEKN